MRYIRENQWLALRESQQVGDLEADALIPRLFESRTPLDRGESVVVTNRRFMYGHHLQRPHAHMLVELANLSQPCQELLIILEGSATRGTRGYEGVGIVAGKNSRIGTHGGFGVRFKEPFQNVSIRCCPRLLMPRSYSMLTAMRG